MAETMAPEVSWRLEPASDDGPDGVRFWCGERFVGEFEAEAFLERGYGNQLPEGGFVLDGPLATGGPVVVDARAEAEIAKAISSFLGLDEPPRPGPRSRPSPLAG